MIEPPSIYILTNKAHGTLYVGVTHHLPRRVWQHKNDFVEGFTSKYRLHTLVYFEQFEDMRSAILREKQLKKWKRQWKLELIQKFNPHWRDLYRELT